MIYYYLDHLMGAYLNQDYDLSGETPEEVVQCYLDSEGVAHASGLAEDCTKFIENNNDVETNFEALYGDDFSPRLWRITAIEFLQKTSEQAKAFISDSESR
ncbi:contact-dependent growth inhibition system immunity protein [Pantoea sp. BAV 3049]|uniref:contact-dependent growth inhibition system immunity protein n=1 Tax=Pantoea sp. BAV 3049 TaxID=2654188 RepID=UPI00131C1AD6|nr:contact-dependent growth inhibition system immunity protein [Pantoea sp. BAV 3049]